MIHETMAKRRKRPSLLDRLIISQRGRCVFCGRIVPKGEFSRGGRKRTRYATREHIVPRSQGGTNEWTNMTMSCNICNNMRGDMPFSMFLKITAPERMWVLKHGDEEVSEDG